MSADVDASRRVLDLTERELRRILLDIHDGPVQSVYAALSQLELLDRILARDAGGDVQREAHRESLVAAAQRVRALLESALGDFRGIVGMRRPPAFESGSLAALLEGLALQHEAATEASITTTCDPALPAVALATKVALYRVTQEALSNAHRHGGARHVAVRVASFTRDGAVWLVLEVRDDGRGFDPAASAAAGHLGLDGMRERTRVLGGTMSVRSRPGHGTTIVVEVPAT